jgi:hypothetical protein
VQGYLVARPMGLVALEAWLDTAAVAGWQVAAGLEVADGLEVAIGLGAATGLRPVTYRRAS